LRRPMQAMRPVRLGQAVWFETSLIPPLSPAARDSSESKPIRAVEKPCFGCPTASAEHYVRSATVPEADPNQPSKSLPINGCYRNQSRPLPLENIEIEVDETRDLDQTTPSPERTGEADENERA
jgi:hypothetical protein